MFKKLFDKIRKNIGKIAAIIAVCVAIYFTCGAVACYFGPGIGPMFGSFGLITASTSAATNAALAVGVLAASYAVNHTATKEVVDKVKESVTDVVDLGAKAVDKLASGVGKASGSLLDGFFKSTVVKVAAATLAVMLLVK